METVTAQPSAAVEPLMAALGDALLKIHTRDRLSGVLTAVAAAGSRLGAPCFVACLLRDPGTDSWHLTTMIDSGGRTGPLDQLGVSTGPFTTAPLFTSIALPLTGVMAGPWGDAACAQLAHRLTITSAMCAPIEDSHGPRGALLALFTGGGQTDIFRAVLAHGITAAARHLAADGGPLTDGVLDARMLLNLAGNEIARAERYHRELAVVLFEMDGLTDLVRVGPMLVRGLRRWDLLGRSETDRPTLVAVLPETGRGGGRGLIRRLGSAVVGIRTGSATFPDDGGSLQRLVEIARGRALRPDRLFAEPVAATSLSNVWGRGQRAERDSDSVRCPTCLTSYMRPHPIESRASVIEAGRAAARAALQVECPRHQDRLVATEPSTTSKK